MKADLKNEGALSDLQSRRLCLQQDRGDPASLTGRNAYFLFPFIPPIFPGQSSLKFLNQTDDVTKDQDGVADIYPFVSVNIRHRDLPGRQLA